MATYKTPPKSPAQMSGAELEDAIRQHLEMAQKLMKEIQARRDAEEAQARIDAEIEGQNSYQPHVVRNH